MAELQLNLRGQDALAPENSPRIMAKLQIKGSLNQSTYQPTPLTKDHPHLLSEDRLSELVVRILGKFNSLQLGDFAWMYFHALRAPLDVTPSRLGAALEMLRRNVAREFDVSSTILPKATYKSKIRPSLLEALKEALGSLDGEFEEEGELLVRKIQANLNYLPHSLQSKSTFELLGLETGDVEKIAMRERNQGAHGMSYSNSEYPTLIYRVRALQALCLRMLLASVGITWDYIDYSTLDFPTRALSEKLGGPDGEGNSA